MKSVKESLLERTSVRRYEREPIPAESMDFIFEAIRNTPTSYNGQQFSVIDIDDQEIKERLYALTDSKQLKTCNRLLIFLSDYNKISLLARRKGLQMPPFTDTMDGVTIGIIDAALAMMSAVVAAQSEGLSIPPLSPRSCSCPRVSSSSADSRSVCPARSPTSSLSSPARC